MMQISRRKALGYAGLAFASPMIPAKLRAREVVKVGFVYVGPIGDFGWTYAHEQGRLALEAEFGDRIETSYVENVAEGPDAERVIRTMAQDGADLVFTTSFGFMNPTLKVAGAFPDVKFEHCTGFRTAPNMSAYNSRFYEGRDVIGTIAGHMSKTGVAGYVASFPIPEVVMGINAFTLAAQRVNPDFRTNVVWVNSWYDPAKEANAATALIDQGADIITQHTDSAAPLQVCEERGLHGFGQAWDMSAFAPEAHLTAIADDWAPYYIQRVQAVIDGTWETSDTWWGMKEGAVVITPYSDAVPEDVRSAAEAIRNGIVDGSHHSFAGPITDQAGDVRISEGEIVEDEALLKMDWYVRGVQA